MMKLNVYASLFMALLAGIVAMSDNWYNAFAAVIIMIFAVFVANNWGLDGEDE